MKKASLIWLVLVQWVLAFEWLHSGWGKWAAPGFMDNIGKTLAGFGSKTPYTTYGSFLNETIVPNAETFGNLIRTGEIGVGLALALAGIILLVQKKLSPLATWLLVVAFLAGALMNLNFFLAAGWSSPSTWGVNLVMGLIHLILGLYYLLNRKDLAS